MKKHIIPILLIANVLIIGGINDSYTLVLGLAWHLLFFVGLIGLGFYALTSISARRFVLAFYSLCLLFGLFYGALNQILYGLTKVYFYEQPELFFALTPEWQEFGFKQVASDGMWWVLLGVVVINILALFKSQADYSELVPKRLQFLGRVKPLWLAVPFLAAFISQSTVQQAVNSFAHKYPSETSEAYSQIITKVVEASQKAEMKSPTMSRYHNEKIGYFGTFQLDEKIAFYSTNCDDARLDIGFFVHLHPENVADIPAQRQKHGFDNIGFDFDRNGVKYKNLCYTEMSLPGYAVTKYRVGQYSRATKDLWSTRFASD